MPWMAGSRRRPLGDEQPATEGRQRDQQRQDRPPATPRRREEAREHIVPAAASLVGDPEAQYLFGRLLEADGTMKPSSAQAPRCPSSVVGSQAVGRDALCA